MARRIRYSPEIRERAVRMVQEHASEHGSEWATIQSIAAKIGCTAETLRKWLRQAELDHGLSNLPVNTIDIARISQSVYPCEVKRQNQNLPAQDTNGSVSELCASG